MISYVTYLQSGGQTPEPSLEEEKLMALVENYLNGHEDAVEVVNGIVVKAKQGDPEAAKTVELINALIEQAGGGYVNSGIPAGSEKSASYPLMRRGGRIGRYQEGGQIQEQVAALVQAAMQGDEQAKGQIEQIMQAAQQGDQKAAQIAQLIQAMIQQMQGTSEGTQSMRQGGSIPKYFPGGEIWGGVKRVGKGLAQTFMKGLHNTNPIVVALKQYGNFKDALSDGNLTWQETKDAVLDPIKEGYHSMPIYYLTSGQADKDFAEGMTSTRQGATSQQSSQLPPAKKLVNPLIVARQKAMMDAGYHLRGGADGIWGDSSRNQWMNFLGTEQGQKWAREHGYLKDADEFQSANQVLKPSVQGLKVEPVNLATAGLDGAEMQRRQQVANAINPMAARVNAGDEQIKMASKGGKTPCPCTLKKVGGRLVNVDCKGNIITRRR